MNIRAPECHIDYLMKWFRSYLCEKGVWSLQAGILNYTAVKNTKTRKMEVNYLTEKTLRLH